MKNGGMLRGTLVDAIPGSQARIQLATGEIATVPWDSIGRIEHGAAGPRPGPPQVAPLPRRQGATVWVHVDGAEGAEIQQDAGDDEWTMVCSAPCDLQLPAGRNYRIGGGGLRASRPFHLAGAPGDHVNIDVNASSTSWFVMGIVIVPVGGLVMVIGLAVGLVGSIVSATTTGVDQSNASSAAGAGWVTFALGAGAMVGGIVLIVNNAHSSVTQSMAGVQTGLLVQGDAWKRVPTWRDATPEQKALPPVVGLPLWSAKF
jgi:hypothetical protein